MVERFSTVFLIAGLGFFALSVLIMAGVPFMIFKDLPMKTIEELAQEVIPEFIQLSEDYPEEFKRHFGQPTPESFREALILGKKVYIREGCWHCHSQYVRPVSNERLRFGEPSKAQEYQNEMNLPHMLGTRRVGPDLIREAGRHSNDWHAAHFYEPTHVVPTSVMPSFRWLLDENDRPKREGLAIITYIQWLGSWRETVPENIFTMDVIAGEAVKQ